MNRVNSTLTLVTYGILVLKYWVTVERGFLWGEKVDQNYESQKNVVS